MQKLRENEKKKDELSWKNDTCGRKKSIFPTVNTLKNRQKSEGNHLENFDSAAGNLCPSIPVVR